MSLQTTVNTARFTLARKKMRAHMASIGSPKNCALCGVIGNSEAGEGYRTIFKNDLCTVVIALHPDKPGHTLVIPQKHLATIWEAELDLQNKLMAVCRILEPAIRKATGCRRVALSVTGLHVPEHFHIHLLPVSQGELQAKALNPAIHKEAAKEELAYWATKIRLHLDLGSSGELMLSKAV